MKNRDIIRNSFSIYMPSLLVQLGASLTMSFDPLWSGRLGADLAMIGLIASGRAIGSVIFDLPGGWIAGRIRKKPFMVSALGLLVIGAVIQARAASPWHLLMAGIIIGIALSAWGIGRVAFIRETVPRELRGRTMAFMGGIMRVARIATPALGGLIISGLGYRALYFIQAGLFASGGIALMMLLKDPGHIAGTSTLRFAAFKSNFRENRRNIVSALVGITGLMLLRISRNLLIPLWAEHIGVSVVMIGLITSAAAIVETAMVIPAGITLDRAGRKWAAVPSTLGVALTIAFLPLTGGAAGLLAVAMLIALANGLGSGINMTISSDLAPREAAAEFLGVWRFVTDMGMLGGPLLVGFIARSLALWASPLAVAALGLSAGLVLLFGMRETSRTPGTGGSSGRNSAENTVTGEAMKTAAANKASGTAPDQMR